MNTAYLKIALIISMILSGPIGHTSPQDPSTASEAKMDKDLSEIFEKGSLDRQRIRWVIPLTQLSLENSRDLQLVDDAISPLFKMESYKKAAEFINGEMGILSPIVVTREALKSVKNIWLNSRIELNSKNSSARGSIEVKTALIKMNNLKYLIVDVPVNSLKSAGIVAGATIWSGALLTIALPTTAGLVSVVVGASLTSYIIRASYSIISTGTFATIYLLDTDVKDIYKMVKRRFSKAQCSSLF